MNEWVRNTLNFVLLCLTGNCWGTTHDWSVLTWSLPILLPRIGESHTPCTNCCYAHAGSNTLDSVASISKEPCVTGKSKAISSDRHQSAWGGSDSTWLLWLAESREGEQSLGSHVICVILHCLTWMYMTCMHVGINGATGTCSQAQLISYALTHSSFFLFFLLLLPPPLFFFLKLLADVALSLFMFLFSIHIVGYHCPQVDQ